MHVVVTIESGLQAGSHWNLAVGDAITFGRTDRSDVFFEQDPTLSSRHFRIEVNERACKVTDLDSTNGTLFNNEKITSQTVGDGDRIKAGGMVFVFDVRAGKQPQVNHPNRSVTERPVRKSDGAKHFPSRGNPHPDVRLASPTVPSAQLPRASTTLERRPANQGNRASLSFQLSKTLAGLWSGTSVGDAIRPIDLIERLSPALNTIFVIDFQRTQLGIGDFTQSVEHGVMLQNIPTEAAALVSPRMLMLQDYVLRSGCTEKWGSEGIFVLFSDVDETAMRSHFQKLMRTRPDDPSSGRGAMGLCWPIVLEAILKNGEPNFAARIIELAEAVLIDSPDSPGGMNLYGDDRLRKLLQRQKIAIVESPSTDHA